MTPKLGLSLLCKTSTPWGLTYVLRCEPRGGRGYLAPSQTRSCYKRVTSKVTLPWVHMLLYNVTSIMLRVHTDVFMKVYWYSINSVTTMVVTLPPSPLRSVSDREDSIYLSLPDGPLDVSDTWSDSPAAPLLLFLPGLHMFPKYVPPAHSRPR